MFMLAVMGLLAISIMPMISADIITPGFHGISVNNYITNVDDFPDYVFVSAPGKGSGPGLGNCEVKIIGEDKNVGDYYKHCLRSIYSIPKEKFDANLISQINYDENRNYTAMEEKWNSMEKTEVIKNIDTYQEVPDSSTINVINNYYTIDLDSLKTEPDNKVIDRNNLIYIYILAPLIVLIIIAIILLKRRK